MKEKKSSQGGASRDMVQTELRSSGHPGHPEQDEPSLCDLPCSHSGNTPIVFINIIVNQSDQVFQINIIVIQPDQVFQMHKVQSNGTKCWIIAHTCRLHRY